MRYCNYYNYSEGVSRIMKGRKEKRWLGCMTRDKESIFSIRCPWTVPFPNHLFFLWSPRLTPDVHQILIEGERRSIRTKDYFLFIPNCCYRMYPFHLLLLLLLPIIMTTTCYCYYLLDCIWFDSLFLISLSFGLFIRLTSSPLRIT